METGGQLKPLTCEHNELKYDTIRSPRQRWRQCGDQQRHLAGVKHVGLAAAVEYRAVFGISQRQNHLPTLAVVKISIVTTTHLDLHNLAPHNHPADTVSPLILQS